MINIAASEKHEVECSIMRYAWLVDWNGYIESRLCHAMGSLHFVFSMKVVICSSRRHINLPRLACPESVIFTLM